MAAQEDPLVLLTEQIESIQNMLKANLSDTADVAELKTKMAFVWGNGKPGILQELKDSDKKLTQAFWYMKGALWVLIGLIATLLVPLAIFLAEQHYLAGHR